MGATGAQVALTQAVKHLRVATARFVVAPGCEIAYRDRPTVGAKDVEPAVRCHDGRVSCPQGLWG